MLHLLQHIKYISVLQYSRYMSSLQYRQSISSLPYIHNTNCISSTCNARHSYSADNAFCLFTTHNPRHLCSAHNTFHLRSTDVPLCPCTLLCMWVPWGPCMWPAATLTVFALTPLHITIHTLRKHCFLDTMSASSVSCYMTNAPERPSHNLLYKEHTHSFTHMHIRCLPVVDW